MKKIIRIVTVLLLGVSLTTRAAKKPNMVVIVADDWGYGDLGALGNRDDVETPNLDRLAKEGVLCTEGYVTAPQCGPSRAGLLTGRHQQRFGFDSITCGPLPLGEITIADRLRKEGYATGMVGKWHMEPNWTNVQWARKLHPELVVGNKVPKIPWEIQLRYFPAARGFDEYYFGEWHRYWHNYELESGDPLSSPVWTDLQEFRVDVQTRAGLAFLRKNAEHPFFLYLGYFAPHVPLESPEKYLKRFPGEMPERRRTALAMMSAVDDGVGKIMDLLEEQGLRDNTLVFFISDNGAPLGAQQEQQMADILPVGKAGPAWDGSRNDPLTGEKGMLMEGGIRVPYLVSWPAVLPRGSTCDQPVSSLDIAATCMAAVGKAVPPGMDGIDLVPLLTGKGSGDRTLYWRFWNQAAIRQGKWKYFTMGDGQEYLVDLDTDIVERHNLMTQYPEKAQELRVRLSNWTDELQPAGLPEKQPNGQEVNWYEFYLKNRGGAATSASVADAEDSLPASYTAMDTDSDGKLSRAEYVEGRAKREKTALMKKNQQTEEQYQANLGNYRGNYDRKFSSEDTNRDGFLDVAKPGRF